MRIELTIYNWSVVKSALVSVKQVQERVPSSFYKYEGYLIN